MRNALKLARCTSYTLLAVLLILFSTVQIQQHFLRRHAEQLHADILALQLHPSTFADLQRFQRKWGTYAKYQGDCTAVRCAYYVALGMVSPQAYDAHPDLMYFAERASYWLGGREDIVTGEILLKQNHTWFAAYSVMLPTGISVTLTSGPRLSAQTDFRTYSLIQRYRLYADVRQVALHVNTTAQTNPIYIARLSQLNFDCLNAWHTCDSLKQLAPNAENDRESASFNPENPTCEPAEARGQEAENVVLAKVQKNESIKSTLPTDSFHQVTFKMQKILKGPATGSPGDPLHLLYESSFYTPDALHAGNTYLVFYQADVLSEAALSRCAVLPSSAQSLAAVKRGIENDSSRGEPYPQDTLWLLQSKVE